MIYIAAVVALLIFIYVNRQVRNRRDGNRDLWRERREEQLQQLLEIKKKKSREHHPPPGETGNDGE